MRLLGLLRNKLMKEDSILHVMKNEGKYYKRVKEAMMMVQKMLGIGVNISANNDKTTNTAIN